MNSFNCIRSYITSLLTLSVLIFSFGLNAYPGMVPVTENEVEEDTSEQPKMPKGPMSKKKEYKTIDEFLEDGEFKSLDGFMNILHETDKDKYFMILNENQLNKEFIYFTYILNGPSDAGPSGGDMGEAFILEFRNFKEDIGI